MRRKENLISVGDYIVGMVSNGPYAAEGWKNFLEDEDDVWVDAFETDEDGNLDVDAYDEFENIQELVNFVAGTGSYADRNSFVPTEEDKDMRKRQMHNDQWKVPEKMEDLLDYIEEGAPYSEVNIDPAAEKDWNLTEHEAHKKDKDTKYTAHFIAYDPEDENNTSFYFAVSWYDKDPKKFNLEEEFDFDDVDGALEE